MSRFTTSDGLSLVYTDEGQGVPLLCLPGLTRNGADFDELHAAVGGRHRLITLTPRGRGESDHDENFLNYTVPVEGRDALELLDHLGLPKAVIIGTSRGGMIAMLIAAMAKDRLAGVLLNDIGPEIDPVGLAQIMTYLGVAPTLASYEAAAAALKSRMAGQFVDVTDEKWLACARRWFAMGPDGLILNYDAKLRDSFEAAFTQPLPDMWPLFDALEGLPVAVLRGANSDLLSAETVARMRARRPDLIVAEVPDRGHVPFLDEPESLAALDELIARVAQ